MCKDNIINQNESQGILFDTYVSAKTGETKVRPWSTMKMQNELLSFAYDSIDSSKASRLRNCASYLTFKRFTDGTLKLDSMSSCRVRLCPMCSWRRSLKNFYNNLAIANYLHQNSNGAWLMLTLTVKSVPGQDLVSCINMMMYGFNKFLKNTKVKKVCRGFYRGLEITHDCFEYITPVSYKRRKKHLDKLGLKVGDRNPTFDLYHPHFHCLIYVDKSYFDNARKYMSVEAWATAWGQALGVDYLPSVDVSRVKEGKNTISGSIAEISKYSTKSIDYIYPDDWDLTVETVELLDRALANRRLIAYGGEVQEAYRALKLEDADSGDLVNIGETETNDLSFDLVTYHWNTGYKAYMS